MGEVVPGGGGVALGVVVGLLSTCIQSVGLTLQRKSHLLEEEKEEEEYGYVRRPPYRRRRWQLGMLMFLISNIVGSTIQITTLPLPVLSTLQASGLVFNTACATLLLHEPFTRYSVIGTLLVAAGALLIALFGAMSEPSHSLDQLLQLLVQRGFLIWLAGTFLVVGGILVAIFLQERLGHRLTHRARLSLGMAYGAVSGVLSAHCLLLAKSAVELLVRTIVDGINQFNRWQSWMILLGLIVLAIAQLYYLHRGLRLCSTSVLYPFVFCIYNIIAILDGLIYFNQASRISPLHAGLIALGTVVLLGGVFALSWRLDPEYQARSEPAADSKAAARVQAPHSALAPGLGMVEETQDDDREPLYIRPGDEEHTIDAANHHIRFDASTEHTPLLRTTTAPNNQQWRLAKTPRSSGKKSFRPPRVRRLTVPDETTDLWDELNNDSNEATRRFSGAAGSPQMQRTPSSSRIRRQHRRSGTGGSGLYGTSETPTRSLFGSIRWPAWDKGKRKQDAPPPFESGDSGEDEDDYDPEVDGADAQESGTVIRRPKRASWTPSGHARRRSEGNRPLEEGEGWFRMKWWKRRWKWDGEQRQRREDEEGDDAGV